MINQPYISSNDMSSKGNNKVIEKCLYIVCFAIFMWSGCKPSNSHRIYVVSQSKFMDEIYKVTIQEVDSMASFEKDWATLENAIESQVNHKDPESSISRFNNGKDTVYFDAKKDEHFIKLWQFCKKFYTKTNGALDPTLAPLFSFYGNGYDIGKSMTQADSNRVKELIKLKTFDRMELIENGDRTYVVKASPDVKISFAAIQIGYLIDRLAEMLNRRGVKNYEIDITSKCRTKGVSSDKSDWIYSINRLDSTKQELPLIISNKSVSSSGLYKNANDSKGRKFAYVVDPLSGMRRLTDILDVTVIAKDCISADAYATAFLAMGREASLAFLKENKDQSACFIYDTEGDGKFEFQISPGFSQYYLDNEQK
jgi:FAD:protein FMN transferase